MDKREIHDLFMNHFATFLDPKKNILYYLDASEESWNGMQIFHMTCSDEVIEEMSRRHDSIVEFCLGCIPAPGAAVHGNKYGYSEWYPFVGGEDGLAPEIAYERGSLELYAFLNKVDTTDWVCAERFD